jgi:hemolysin activation/secretion protein
MVPLKSNRFNGVIGMLPKQSSSEQVLITGMINLHLKNMFASGKSFQLDWQGFAQNSQKLLLNYQHPFFFGSRCTLSFTFDLLRQDTSFLQRHARLEIVWPVGKKGSLGLLTDQFNSSVLTSNIELIVQNKLESFSRNLLGATYRHGRSMEFDPSPNDHWYMSATMSAGIKRRDKLSFFPEVYYIGQNLESVSFISTWSCEWQRMITRFGGLYFKSSGGIIDGQRIPNTEKFRLGGLRSIRGFNEQLFFADAYALLGLEWRQYFEEASFIYAFLDQGLSRQSNWQYLRGVGGGLGLKTNTGAFNFAMALGKAPGFSASLAEMKIHFGYTSVF